MVPSLNNSTKQTLDVNILASSSPLFKVDTNQTIKLIHNIGKGTYSYVYTIHNRKYVIKIMKPSYKPKDLKDIKAKTKKITECNHFYMCENYREIDIVKRLIKCQKYPSNLVKIVAYGQLSSPLTTITPFPNKYFPTGTYIVIEQYYRGFQKYFAFPQQPTQIQLIKFIFDMKQAFKQLLKHTGYVHLDPKLSNIYISNDGTKFLLSDFNLVQKYKTDHDRFKTYGRYYLHPQRHCSLPYLPYYSLGITLLELVHSKTEVYNLDKLDGHKHTLYLQNILKHYKESKRNDTSMYKFIKRCVNLECKVSPFDGKPLSPPHVDRTTSPNNNGHRYTSSPPSSRKSYTPPNPYPSPSSVPSNVRLYNKMQPKSL